MILDERALGPGNGARVFIAGPSPAMRTLERVIVSIAPTDIPVLIVGETGTGKEMVAAEIHRFSPHRNAEFLRVNCATLTPELLERQFGDAANGKSADAFGKTSTIFLDEVFELDAACQAKLLQILTKVNGNTPEDGVGPRVIAATSRNLEAEVAVGRFSEELYYRLKSISVSLCPLRHRKEDIPTLLDSFVRKYAVLFHHPLPKIGPPTLQKAMEYPWPGNVRELENVALKIAALGDEQAVVPDLTAASSACKPATQSDGLSLKLAARTASRQAERELILKVLERTHWNRKRAARELQISYKALLYKVKQLALDDSSADL